MYRDKITVWYIASITFDLKLVDLLGSTFTLTLQVVLLHFLLLISPLGSLETSVLSMMNTNMDTKRDSFLFPTSNRVLCMSKD